MSDDGRDGREDDGHAADRNRPCIEQGRAGRNLELIQQGAKLIFPQSFGYLQPALNVAKRHPDVIFEHPAGNKLASNLGTFWSDTTSYEYLMGVVAGKSTKTNKLGWVVGYPIPNILVSINAFELGARSVNPKRGLFARKQD